MQENHKHQADKSISIIEKNEDIEIEMKENDMQIEFTNN